MCEGFELSGEAAAERESLNQPVLRGPASGLRPHENQDEENRSLSSPHRGDSERPCSSTGSFTWHFRRNLYFSPLKKHSVFIKHF